MRKIIILTVVFILLTSTAIAENLYPLVTAVIEINKEDNTVISIDFNGNEWQFEGVQDWILGDIANFLMFDNYTDEIEDDKILCVYYDGYFSAEALEEWMYH